MSFLLGKGYLMQLPPQSEDQSYCIVSALEAGHVHCHADVFLDNASPDTMVHVPCLSFLLQHSASKKQFLFDLGIRKDWESAPPKLVERITPTFGVEVPQDVVESLAKGGLTPLDIDTVCPSHLHFDHVGYTPPFSKSNFVVGGETKKLFEDGFWPTNPDSVYPTDILPIERTTFLGEDIKWQAVGPFPKAYDFYGDGSLYIVDAPGHVWGHVNLLARTSADGAWVYLAGDTAHHWNLIEGTSGIACVHPGHAKMHLHKDLAEETIGRVREVMKIPRIRVLLAHDKPWYDENKGRNAFLPGQIESL
jgi:glyoxylase-like metal-dependent hydrolase (beta-lactamase superfamily II)